MARKEVERQLRLFGVGDLGSLDEEDGSLEPEGVAEQRWDDVFRHLGRLLREEGFGAYLARCQRDRDQSGRE